MPIDDGLDDAAGGKAIPQLRQGDLRRAIGESFLGYLQDLFGISPRNVFLIKFSYGFNL